MFDIAWSEFMVVAVVALVVVGPRDLPALLRTVGKTVATLRRMAGEFQTQFNDAMREAELDELQKDISGLKDKASRMVSAPNPLQIARDEIRTAIEAKPSALAGAASQAPAEDAPSALAPAPELPPATEAPPVTDAELSPPAPDAEEAAPAKPQASAAPGAAA